MQRQAREAFPDADLTPAAILAEADLSALADSGEIEMMRLLAQYPRVIESAALAREPHRIAFHLYEIAASLHGFLEQGQRIAAITIC